MRDETPTKLAGLVVLLVCTANNWAHAGPLLEGHDANHNTRDYSGDNFAVLSIPPDIKGMATSGEVDGQGLLEAALQAIVTDACGVLASEVSIEIAEIAANATLGAPEVNTAQLDPMTVKLSVAVPVSRLGGSPAGVRFSVTAVDNCGLRTTRHFLALIEGDPGIEGLPRESGVSETPGSESP